MSDKEPADARQITESNLKIDLVEVVVGRPQHKLAQEMLRERRG